MTLTRQARQPRYTLTPVIARHLMEIEAARAYTLLVSYRRYIGALRVSAIPMGTKDEQA